MYGDTPSAKIENDSRAPPPNISMRATALALFIALPSSSPTVTPGTVIAAPIRMTRKIMIVNMIRVMISLFLNIEAIFFILKFPRKCHQVFR